jgi:uncharacterized protein YceH (UPF0502 family)
MSDTRPSPLTPIQFDPIEARIIGCLMEKQRTTPDQYPLTLNALVSACNQKSSRHPVMQLGTGEVGHAVNGLRDRGLVHAGFTGRTERYDHKMVGTFHLGREEQAVLTVLLLRGPQTLGELRTNSARLADFPDLESVQRAVIALIEHVPSLAMELPRAPGRREERYAHLLCGMPDLHELPEPTARSQTSAAGRGTAVAGEDRISALEEEVARLRAQVERLWELAGLDPPEDAV